VQDGTVIHATAQVSTTVGDGCVIGHLAHLEGCVLEDDCLVGSGSVVLHRAVVGHGATVGANAVVTNDMTVPADALAVGVPAVIKEGRSSLDFNQGAAALYVANGQRYKATLVRLDRS
jgi:carbonic anhydrase/acetyltransferase-like protein (isoleucine patch superfamily)